MRDNLRGSWIWIWEEKVLQGPKQAILLGQLERIPGEVGVLIKAAGYGQLWADRWNQSVVDAFRAAGVGVGLWIFCRGSAGHYGGVAAELTAVRQAVDAAAPDAVVLNIEGEITDRARVADPAAEVYQLVQGATAICGPVGVSTVWHLADWPFAAAVEGGLAYWANQVYSADWPSYRDYAKYKRDYGGGKADYPALWAWDEDDGYAPCASALSMREMAHWATHLQGATGFSWWRAGGLTDERWRGVRECAEFLSPAAMFASFCQSHGGIPVFGLPLGEPKPEACDDGVMRTVQYFERAVLEHHSGPVPVMGRLLGSLERDTRYPDPAARPAAFQSTDAGAERFFSETGHSLQGPFRQYFEVQPDSILVFGLPISDAFREACDDGVSRLVQYFERAVLELHDEGGGRPLALGRLLGHHEEARRATAAPASPL